MCLLTTTAGFHLDSFLYRITGYFHEVQIFMIADHELHKNFHDLEIYDLTPECAHMHD